MGRAYRIACSECGYHRDLLLGQGDDAFYEFYEERCFVCDSCHELTVVTVPLPLDLLLHMQEEGFAQPWSEVTAAGDDPDNREQQCSDLINQYRLGMFDELHCGHCGSVGIEQVDGAPTNCPRCQAPSLEIRDEFEWA